MDFSTPLELALLDAVETAVGVSPSLVLYSGARPADCAAADPSGPLITFSLPSNWLADAAGGQKVLAGLWTALVTNSGTALSFRIKQGATAHVQGDVSGPAGAGDLVLEVPALIAGQSLTIESWTFLYATAASGIAAATLSGVTGRAVGSAQAPGTPPSVPTGLPVWVPDLDRVATISFNTLDSPGVYPGPVGSGYNAYSTKVTAWNSGAFSPDYSTFGGYIVVGGGDGDWHGNEVCVFDLNTRLWVRINEPSTAVSDADYLNSDLVYGEWPDGKPGMPHGYGAVGYLPPALGGGTKGSLLLIWKTYWHRGYGTSGHAHKCDLATGIWSRASSIAGTSNVSTWAFDSRRNRFVGTYTGPSPATGRVRTFGNFLNGIGAHGTEGPDHFSVGSTGSSEYVPTCDALVQIGANTSFVMELRGYDLLAGNGTRYTLKITGDPLPGGAAHGMAWVPDTNALYVLSTVAGQQQYIWKIAPPVGADWRTGNWTCTRIQMQGVTISETAPENGIWQRLRYAPSIKSLIWVHSVGGPVYCYRVANALPAITVTTTSVPVVTTSGAANIVTPASKHLQFVQAGDRWYKMVGDHKPDDPQSFTDYGGRQEIYSFRPALNDWRRDQGFYLTDPLQVQVWAPDDAFAIHRNGEIWVFVSVRNMEVPPNPLPRAVGPKATQVYNAVMAWTVPNGPWRIVRYFNGSQTLGEEWRSGNAWRALYDADMDRIIIPLQQNGLKLHITDGATGQDISVRNPTTGALQGYGDRWLAHWVRDPSTRYAYSVDWMHGQLWRINLDNLADRVYLLTCPDEVNTTGSWFLKPTYLVWHPVLRAIIAGGNHWNVYEVDSGRYTQFPRQDGFHSTIAPYKWVTPSDWFYDGEINAVISIGGIDWAGGTPPPAVYYKNVFSLGLPPDPYTMRESEVNATYFDAAAGKAWAAPTGNGCDWRDRNGNFRGEIPLTGDTTLVTSTAYAYMAPPNSTIAWGGAAIKTSCTITSLVTEWRTNGNRGLILRGGNDQALASRNHLTPTLNPYIEVVIGGQTYRCECKADAEWNSVAPASFYGLREYNEQTSASNESKKVIMQFDIAGLPPGTVTSATLYVSWVYVGNNNTGIWVYLLYPPT
jgi:hypothetical protein